MNKTCLSVSTAVVLLISAVIFFLTGDSAETKMVKAVQNRDKPVNIVMLGNSITAWGNWAKLLGRNDIKKPRDRW